MHALVEMTEKSNHLLELDVKVEISSFNINGHILPS